MDGALLTNGAATSIPNGVSLVYFCPMIIAAIITV